MSVKLFVGGLAWSTTDDSLREAFSKYGEVYTFDSYLIPFPRRVDFNQLFPLHFPVA
jgi:RNA recognition motif-containing protein